MNSFLIATTNPGKLAELKKGFASLEKKELKIYSLSDLKIIDDPDETGKTFEENALLKAKFYSRLSGLPTVADDGGLIIPYLNNEPGIMSRRWPGYSATDEELINYCLNKLNHVVKTKRKAYLTVTLCFYDPSGKTHIFETGKIKGRIAEKPSSKREKGYPYRALLIVDKFEKYYDDLTEKEHIEINHRLKAVKRLAKKIEKVLLQ